MRKGDHRQLFVGTCSCGTEAQVRFDWATESVRRRIGPHRFLHGRVVKTKSPWEVCTHDAQVPDDSPGYQYAYHRAVFDHQLQGSWPTRFEHPVNAEALPFFHPDPGNRHKALAQVLDVRFEHDHERLMVGELRPSEEAAPAILLPLYHLLAVLLPMVAEL